MLLCIHCMQKEEQSHYGPFKCPLYKKYKSLTTRLIYKQKDLTQFKEQQTKLFYMPPINWCF